MKLLCLHYQTPAQTSKGGLDGPWVRCDLEMGHEGPHYSERHDKEWTD